MKRSRFILFLSFIVLADSCTKLNENVGSNLTQGQVAVDSSRAVILLQGVYASMEWTFTSFLEVFALSELTTDEAIAPTRGNNWDDNGMWRVLHEHKYDQDSKVIHDCFNSLSGIVYAATDVLQFKLTKGQQAEARFLRAWAMYWLLDMYDQVPYRDPGDGTVEPAKVRKGIDALTYIIGELNKIEPDLLSDAPANRANKYAALTLLMKCYLNKHVYINRASPARPDAADMNEVINLADVIIKSGKYTFSKEYFDNFSPTNEADTKENIFTQARNFDGSYVVALSWIIPLSYPQGGANGFSTLSDFYDKFESTDKRKGFAYDYSNSPPNPGRRTNVGLLIGQQYDSTDTPLTSPYTNQGNPVPVFFTPDVQNIQRGDNIEMPGIRPIKYPPDWENFCVGNCAPATNEFVYLRFPDVLLMKAEAILRGGTPTSAGSYGSSAEQIVNSIRTDPSRGASYLPVVNLDTVYNERGRELWWENWRRQDMIRFGTFLGPFQEKEYTSDERYLLFPISYEQLGVNKYLTQNPGY